MEDNAFPILLGWVLSLAILYFVIKAAVRDGNNSKKRDELLQRQIDILKAMAKKQGVDVDNI